MRKFLGFIRFTFYISLIAVIAFFCVRYFNYYKVTFVVDDIAYTKIVKKGEILKDLDEPTKEGHTFLYWTDDSIIIDNEYAVNYDTVLLAVFEKDEEIESYYVSFDSMGGSVVEGQVINKGDTIVEPTVPVKEGYTFKEWQLNNKSYDFNTPVDSDITLTATYIKRVATKYMVTFNTHGGTKIANKYVAANGTIKMPNNPVRDGYIFKEWQLNGKKYDFNTKVTSDITLNAVYSIDNREVYVVKFDTKGGTTIKEQYVRSGEKITAPSNPTRVGYKFSNWIYNNEAYSFSTKVTSNMVLTAAYVKVENKTPSTKIIREYASDTLKYKIEDKGTYAITHIWVKDAYNQFKAGVKEPFPQLATSNSIMSYVCKSKNYTNKEMIGTNASGIVSDSFYVGVGKAVPEWKNSSVSPVVLVEGIVKRNSINTSFPALNVYTYGLKKDGYLSYYNLRHNNNVAARTTEFNKMINDGVKNTFSFNPVLIHNGIVNNNLKHDNNIRQAIGQIDLHNFVFITTTTTNRSKGLSPASLASIMKDLKCVEAYNLDGGGSASLIYKPKGTNTTKSVLYTSRAVADIIYFVE